MRTDNKVQDVKLALYRLRMSRGRYLSDVPLCDLCKEEQFSLAEDAERLLFSTGIELRRVKRGHRKVWRFMNKNGL